MPIHSTWLHLCVSRQERAKSSVVFSSVAKNLEAEARERQDSLLFTTHLIPEGSHLPQTLLKNTHLFEEGMQGADTVVSRGSRRALGIYTIATCRQSRG